MINPEKQALLLIEQHKEKQSGIASVKRNKSGACLYEIIWNDITANTWEPLENLAPRLSEFKEYDCLCVCRVLPLTHSGTQIQDLESDSAKGGTQAKNLFFMMRTGNLILIMNKILLKLYGQPAIKTTRHLQTIQIS